MPPVEQLQILAVVLCFLVVMYLMAMDIAMPLPNNPIFTPCRIGACLVGFLGLLNILLLAL